MQVGRAGLGRTGFEVGHRLADVTIAVLLGVQSCSQ